MNKIFNYNNNSNDDFHYLCLARSFSISSSVVDVVNWRYQPRHGEALLCGVVVLLDSIGIVTHIEHSLKACPPANSNLVCPTYFPEKDSLYVLETVAGFSMKHDVRVGTHVSFGLVK